MWDLLKYGENVALIDELGLQITYGQLDAVGESLSAAVGGRCLIVCMCQNALGSVVGYITFINHGIVPIMLNAHMESELKEALIERYKPKYIWASEDVMLMSENDNLKPIYRCYGYALWETGYGNVYPMHDDLALLLTTSGSTGSPKFVRQSYKNIKANTESIIDYLKLDATEKPITTLPMNYTYGLSIINTHIMAGATILLTEKSVMQKAFWDFWEEHGATSFGGVPYTYEILKRLRFLEKEYPSLRTMTQAGGKITPELHEEFANFAADNGKKFVVMYGQCEATARMGYLPAEMAQKKPGSMGIAIPGGKFTLIDENERPIKTEFVTGELVYEGDNVTLGYAECGEDLIKGDERGGILHTGDMAQFDEDGYYYIVGRKKRFLKIYGNRVNLDEIDRMVKAKFENIDFASSGEDDHMYLFITDEAYKTAVKDFVVSKTKLNQVAFQTIVLDDIPKNDAGKILYRELEKFYK